MKEKPRMTLAEMAARASGTAGKLVCPKCGCADLRVDKTKRPASATFRRRVCRHCGNAFETIQPPEEFLREIEPRNSNDAELDEYSGENIL